MQISVGIVKAIIVKDSKFLVLVRRKDGLLDLPGGKLEKGEGVCQGLVREVSEETGLVFERPEPVNWWILPTAEGMKNGITFCCDYKHGSVILSQEHTEYFWQDLKYIKHFTPQTWVDGFWGMKEGIMLFDRFYPQYQFEEELSNMEITVINIKCPFLEPKPEDTFFEHYIFKDFSENYLEMKKPPESDIIFPPRMP
jgi:8-oxo-dGTP pyrophosphatase MutT (NUDIX family)